MKYSKTVILKNGMECHLRSGAGSDGAAVYENFQLTHGETDYLLSYPDENSFGPEKEAEFLTQKAESPNEVEIVAFVDGKVVGTAGIDAVGSKYKVRHRAEFGISLLKEYWGLGIGRALMDACIRCARNAGYAQLELDVVADNARAISMYEKAGFVEYGRNPKGFHSRTKGYQELVYMRLELN
ncbi:MAG: GNAT family N-acetyltransferase [Oscillospiraceae bacterium]|nr:GNAT family N-acetyltransferase [Oscillospiraceae bacterium]